MKIALFGATGIVGNAVLKYLLQCGIEVNVLTRCSCKVRYSDSALKVFEGDVMNPKVVESVVSGCDAVIQTLGIGGKGNDSKTTVVSDANKVIISCMRKKGISRYVAISAIGAGDSMAYLPGVYRRFILPYFQKWFIPIIDDKNRMEADIFKSDLKWTVVRATTVKNGRSKGRAKISLDGKGIKYTVAASELARVMVDMVKDGTYVHQTPVVCN